MVLLLLVRVTIIIISRTLKVTTARTTKQPRYLQQIAKFTKYNSQLIYSAAAAAAVGDKVNVSAVTDSRGVIKVKSPTTTTTPDGSAESIKDMAIDHLASIYFMQTERPTELERK